MLFLQYIQDGFDDSNTKVKLLFLLIISSLLLSISAVDKLFLYLHRDVSLNINFRCGKFCGFQFFFFFFNICSFKPKPFIFSGSSSNFTGFGFFFFKI